VKDKKDLSPDALDCQIRRVILKTHSSYQKKNVCPQKASLDSSLAENQLVIGVKFPSTKFKRILSYLVLYHYYPQDELISCYFQLDLFDFIKGSPEYWFVVLLENQDLFLKYLIEQEVLTEQQFFAGIVNVKNLEETLDSIVFQFEERLKRPRRLVRRKGYRDKGSLGNPSFKGVKDEIEEDSLLNYYQWYLEEKEILKSDHCALFREFLSEGRVLTDDQMIEFKLKKGEVKEHERSREPWEVTYIKERSSQKIRS